MRGCAPLESNLRSGGASTPRGGSGSSRCSGSLWHERRAALRASMTPQATLTIAYVLLATLLGWLVIGSRGRWWAKLPLLVIVPVFGFALWHALGDLNGWPTRDTPP